jgi:hypothetical protein
MISPRRNFLTRHKILASHSPWLAILAVGAAFSFYAAADALWSGDDTDALLATPVPVAAAPPRLRCETCGVIEAIRATAATESQPAAWTLTVRMRDGSLRHSSAPLPGRWQVGESVQLIGGERTWSLPYVSSD